MFTCEYCNRSFSRKDHLARHGDCRAAVQICDVCGGIYKSEGALRRHKREKHEVPKAKRPAAAPIAADEPKRPRLDLPEASTSSSSPSSTRHCTQCNLTIPAMRWQGHLRTLAHRQKCSVVQEPGVEMIQTSFRNRIVTYRLASTINPTDVKGFLDHLRSKILTLVESNVRRYGNVKVGMELFGNFLLQTKEQEEVKSFNTKYRLVSGNTDLEELYVQFVDILATKASEFQERDSGWALEELLHLE
ncbi:early growth response protein 1-like isoform X2 [Cylas formicarius]|uniref:early growth response protein 1-like isoform X2 n=1 Tax=Cylas formicarius TaxID=197179 RepID=UPI00295831E9|nr:early growth response protein 1-like isoform X2 [Cylas formicarius]